MHFHDNHNPADSHCCSGNIATPSVHQTLGELDFSRGIWTAALNNDIDCVIKMIDRGTDPNVIDSSGYTALHYASRSGHLQICEILLERSATPDIQTKSGGVTALHRAAYCGHLDIVKLLIKHKADGLIQDTDGKTAFHKVLKAAERGHVEVLKYLADRFQSGLNIKDKHGQLPRDVVPPDKLDLVTALHQS